MNVIETSGLSKRYGSRWALRDCTLAIPAGHVVALVGPNGAGKTTLLSLAVGLTVPTAGIVRVLGGSPAGMAEALHGIAFVAQDVAIYKNLSAADMLHMTRNLNRRFDQRYAEARLGELGIPLNRKAGELSGGQQAQLSLTLALARRPRLLVLDEPMAMLDPLARHDFMATVMAAVADDGVSVLLSSHVLAELERVADYLVLLSRGHVQAAGEVEDMLAHHRVLTGPTMEADRYTERLSVVHARRGAAQAHLLVRTNGTTDPVPPGWEAHPVSLEELTLSYLREPMAAALPGPARAADDQRNEANGLRVLAMPAEPRSDAILRPVPWRRMAWVIWRQHRLTLAGVVALFGVASAYLLITGLPIHDAYAAVAGCRPAGSDLCRQATNDFLRTYAPGVGITFGLLQAIPALIGAFVGAPLLAREFETGTFRYAWTQGFGRVRWTVAKLTPLAFAVTVAAAAFSALISWYVQPIFGAGDNNGPLYPTLFDLSGVALAAWTLAAFAIGLLAGILVRRVVPAMFATVAAWAALAFGTGAFLRAHYEAPLVTSNPNIPTGAWVINQGWFKGGSPASLDMINRTLAAVDVRAVTPELFQPGPSTPANLGDPVQYLIQHGIVQWTTYQPVDRFWPFQWIEGGWLLALSLLLTAVTIWLVRRRAA
ncbi:MAG TPA: ABC transporter ATP-binding protein [Candidatus Sulfotelmatobacter sp.]|nr:ABC transporter ATP-binding protein [Candidatus Sulfotelmatobacter sp.]